tara:strand:+ start:1704 stop:2003 length:300 start_codon:yes stop_codon:yes gene_type:complete
MTFIEIIKKKKLFFISIFLFFYILFNFLEGERGLFSYLEKKKIKELLIKEEMQLANKIKAVKLKNVLLSDNLDLDYIETLYREKFMVGKIKEKIYITSE